jgi:hypothetical protein
MEGRPFCFRVTAKIGEKQMHAPYAPPVRAELTGSDRCRALGIETHGLLDLCRKLIAAGSEPTLPLEAYRGDILCLRIRSIGEGARLRVASHGIGFEALQGCTGASSAAPIGLGVLR